MPRLPLAAQHHWFDLDIASASNAAVAATLGWVYRDRPSGMSDPAIGCAVAG